MLLLLASGGCLLRPSIVNRAARSGLEYAGPKCESMSVFRVDSWLRGLAETSN